MVTELRKKMVVVGDSKSGKTWLLFSLLYGCFPDQGVPVLPNLPRAKVELQEEGTVVEFDLWDTIGSDAYDRIRPSVYSGTDVVLIVFAIDSRESLENVAKKWFLETSLFIPRVPVVLVGNKADLLDESEFLERVLETTKMIKAYGFCLCSAKTGQGIKSVLNMAAKAVLMHKEPSQNRCRIL